MSSTVTTMIEFNCNSFLVKLFRVGGILLQSLEISSFFLRDINCSNKVFHTLQAVKIARVFLPREWMTEHLKSWWKVEMFEVGEEAIIVGWGKKVSGGLVGVRLQLDRPVAVNDNRQHNRSNLLKTNICASDMQLVPQQKMYVYCKGCWFIFNQFQSYR